MLFTFNTMENLIKDIKSCTLCATSLPYAPKPIFSFVKDSKILIIGQAPGQKVQDSGIPWNDASGKELRRWLNVSDEEFYNPKNFAIVPMGFCFPGTAKGGDLPPRPECAPKWHTQIHAELKNIQLILLIGQYAHNYYLPKSKKPTLTENVQQAEIFLPQYFPLVHPSPRNKIWHKRNPWFENEKLPVLQKLVKSILK